MTIKANSARIHFNEHHGQTYAPLHWSSSNSLLEDQSITNKIKTRPSFGTESKVYFLCA